MKIFKIKSRISDKFYWVYIYSTLKEMRNDATEYDKKSTLKQSSNYNSLAVTHCYVRERIYSNGKRKKKKDIGIIRFVDKRLITEIVAHEIVHASMWNYRVEFTKDEIANFKDGCNPDEEKYAYLYGQLFRDITIKLYKYKYW